MKNKTLKINSVAVYILFSVTLACIIMALIDGVWQPTYLVKSICKITLFMSVIALCLVLFPKSRAEFFAVFKPSKKGLAVSLLIALGVFGIIVAAYFTLRNVFDFSGIVSMLDNNGITPENFVFVSVYISFINSFIEEIFFRGFAFLTLKHHSGRMIAYLFSSFAFAAYHVAIMKGWFNIPIFILAMLGLTVGGYIFDFLNEKFDNIYLSWAVHAFANFGINFVGFMLLGIL